MSRRQSSTRRRSSPQVAVVLPANPTAAPKCPLHGPMLALMMDNGRTGGGPTLRHCCSFTRRPGACVSGGGGGSSSSSSIVCCRLDEALATPRQYRAYCLDCRRLVLGQVELASCVRHRLMRRLARRRLLAPTGFLAPLTERQSSQYFFSPSSLAYLLRVVRRLRCRALISVGCPRLHEAAGYAVSAASQRCRSLLLDLDSRLGEFFPDWFGFNMFNAAFSQADELARFQRLLRARPGGGGGSETCLIIADPPFGGLLSPLMSSLDWLAAEAAAAGYAEVFTAVAVPYYLGKRWLLPRLRMHDCQLTYSNHAKLRSASNSTVRLFSDVPEARLPAPSGTRWCADCLRHSADWNPHCYACGGCVTDCPPARVHCSGCDRCVKAKYIGSHDCRPGIADRVLPNRTLIASHHCDPAC